MRRDLAYCILATTIWAGTSLFCPSFAKAASQCSEIFSSEYDLKGRIEVQATVAGQLPVTAYGERLAAIDALLGSLVPATDSPVTVGTNIAASSYNPATKQIYLGLRHAEMGKKNPEVNLNTLAHEYGHAIFEKNLQKDLESYRALIKEVLIIEKQFEEAKTQSFALKYKADVTFDKVAKESLLAQSRDKADEAMAMQNRYKEIKSYWSVRSALHEIFADAVALAVTKDPKAIEKVLIDDQEQLKKHSSKEINLRDMTDGRHHASRRTWDKENWLHTKIMSDIYYAFLPARWELWKVSKSRLDGELYRKQFLTKVFTILERNLSETIATPAGTIGFNGFNNIEKLNKQIIEDFHREL